MMGEEVTLYAIPMSLYSGRARSYLIKAGIPYREITPTTAHYRDQVLPKAGHRQGIPTLELTSGEVIRDGAAIVDHFETANGNSFSPDSPRQRIVSLMFDVIGAEGLLRPAMHYRWNFPEQNLDFLRVGFQSMVPPNLDREQVAEKMMNNMRGACQAFGAVPDTFDLVESLYERLLTSLDAHFKEYPYLLGGKPCIGDFGMIAPLYAHLGRDPKPLALMQSKAIQLFRWVERMNRPEPDIGEYENQLLEYLPNDEVPDTLVAVLQHIAIDFVPETLAAADFINHWLEDQQDMQSGTAAERGVGLSEIEIEGVTVRPLVQPYRFYLLSRVQQAFDELSQSDQQAVSGLLEQCDMRSLLDARLTRQIGRHNNLEVWL